MLSLHTTHDLATAPRVPDPDPAQVADLRRLGQLTWGAARRLPNIVLVGGRAVGKSRISRRLAKTIHWTRVSTDDSFKERYGPIPRFVREFGWERFQDRETELLAGISGQRLVVDCGEGVVERPENLAILRELGIVYWVRARTQTLARRMHRKRGKATPRDSGPAEEALAVFEKRTALYRMAAECDIWSTPRAASSEVQPVSAVVAAHFGPRLAFTVAAPTVPEVRAGIVTAWAEAGPLDLIELRLDHLEEPAPTRLAEILEGVPEHLRARMIARVLRSADGGRFAGPEQDRILLLLAAARRRVGYLDVELEPDRARGWAFSRRLHAAASQARLVASYYHPDRPGADLEGIPTQMDPMHPAIRKIVTRAAETGDVGRLVRLIRDEAANGRAFIAVSSGAGARALPVVAYSAGAAVATYASPSGRSELGDGEPPAQAIRDRYFRWGARLSAPVPVYGSVGYPIRYVMSPAIYESAFRRAGIEAAYLSLPVPPAELGDFLTAARVTGVAGLNVAVPHQAAVLEMLDECEDDTRKIGAVDTIVAEGERLIGASTVWRSAVQALEEHVSLLGKRVTVIGAGATARSVVYGLVRCGAHPTVVDRDERGAADLAETFGAESSPLDRLEQLAGDVLVNATPVGMLPRSNRSPAPPAAIRNHSLVMDLVDNPRRTKLLTSARASGKVIVPGINMVIYQAAAAFQRWTGRPAPVRAMRDAANRAYRAQ